MEKRSFESLCWILGDQLNIEHPWFSTVDDDRLFVIAELYQETAYCTQHVQKICAFFLAMENFADALRAKGHRVKHLSLDETVSFGGLPELIEAKIVEHSVSTFYFQRPDEFRLLNQFRSLRLPDGVVVKEQDSGHFFFPFSEIVKEFVPGKSHRMESFYRRMRKRFGILMNGSEPEGGEWNFDKQNREKLSQSDIKHIPKPLTFFNNAEDVLARLKKHNVKFIGKIPDQLPWPVSRDQALELLEFFCAECLPNFGRFQDAMATNHDLGWSLYHSRLSFALNSKMLSPAEVLNSALHSYETNKSLISIAQIEGFVRQVLGWREFIRALYWINMPDYKDKNYFKAKRKLPNFFWTGETKMACMRRAIEDSLQYSYSHHIHRLMITGNFCLLTGVSPDEVDDWYLGVYIDGIEWAELPNTRGMSQYADGGIVASKPYSASGNYISKMSDYCKNCRYKVKETATEEACPFNSLYWRFLEANKDSLAKNPRNALVYSSWYRKKEDEREAILLKADRLVENIEDL